MVSANVVKLGSTSNFNPIDDSTSENNGIELIGQP